jgi:hypothetical protein
MGCLLPPETVLERQRLSEGARVAGGWSWFARSPEVGWEGASHVLFSRLVGGLGSQHAMTALLASPRLVVSWDGEREWHVDPHTPGTTTSAAARLLDVKEFVEGNPMGLDDKQAQALRAAEANMLFRKLDPEGRYYIRTRFEQRSVSTDAVHLLLGLGLVEPITTYRTGLGWARMPLTDAGRRYLRSLP